MAKVLASVTGSISFSQKGDKGDSGDTPYVTKTAVSYAITSSISDSKNWTSTAPDASAASNKGKFIWTRIIYTWSNNKTTENITYTYIGKDGNGIKSTEVTYQIGSSGTEHPNGDWSPDVQNITDEKPYLWTRTIFVYTNGTHSDPSFSVATRGTKGALMREHDGFESGSYKYLSGSGAEAYVDVVYIKKSDKWWQCIITYDDATDSPKLDDGHWKEMNSFKSIATHLLLAENATINMLGSNQINLYTPSSGAMYGSFRVVNTDNDWSLWLGGKDGDSASFAVTRGGAIKATAGTIGSFTIRELQGGYYDFYANYKGIANFSAPSSISLNSLGISASTGVPGNGAQFFFGNNEFTGGTPSWGNGALRVSLNTTYGADASQVAANISVFGKPDNNATALQLSATGGANNHAIAIRDGDVAGLRPSFVRITSNYTLTEYNHTVECYNTSAITIYLPSSPKYGQCYTIIQRGGRVNISSDINIYDTHNTSSATTWYSDTRGQVSWLWYNGIQWIVSYATR